MRNHLAWVLTQAKHYTNLLASNWLTKMSITSNLPTAREITGTLANVSGVPAISSPFFPGAISLLLVGNYD